MPRPIYSEPIVMTAQTVLQAAPTLVLVAAYSGVAMQQPVHAFSLAAGSAALLLQLLPCQCVFHHLHAVQAA